MQTHNKLQRPSTPLPLNPLCIIIWSDRKTFFICCVSVSHHLHLVDGGAADRTANGIFRKPFKYQQLKCEFLYLSFLLIISKTIKHFRTYNSFVFCTKRSSFLLLFYVHLCLILNGKKTCMLLNKCTRRSGKTIIIVTSEKKIFNTS